MQKKGSHQPHWLELKTINFLEHYVKERVREKLWHNKRNLLELVFTNLNETNQAYMKKIN